MVGATAVMIGTGGGIGAALVEARARSVRYSRVHALCRDPTADRGVIAGGLIDVADEASIRHAAERVGSSLDLVVIANGILHEGGRMNDITAHHS